MRLVGQSWRRESLRALWFDISKMGVNPLQGVRLRQTEPPEQGFGLVLEMVNVWALRKLSTGHTRTILFVVARSAKQAGEFGILLLLFLAGLKPFPQTGGPQSERWQKIDLMSLGCQIEICARLKKEDRPAIKIFRSAKIPLKSHQKH